MIEIEFIGTGGQGSVVAGKLLADAAVKAGYRSQAFASYGAQRRGGNVESYVRLSEDTIRNHSKIYGADYVIVMDKGMVENAQEQNKLRKGATVIINTPESPDAYPDLKECNVITLDANRIALRRGVTLPSGMPIINTTILGALWALLPSATIDQLIESFREGHIPSLEKNIEAVREAYASIKESLKSPGKQKQAAEVVEEASIVGDRLPEYRPKLAPCEANCPAGEKIEKTALCIQYGQFEEALENIKEENPFPGICGRVCFHPCETNCNRVQFDEGIATNALERAAYDFANPKLVNRPEKKPATGKKVAIIGSGPAGMTCAYYLALLGHNVTVFEAQPVAGGVPRFGIPEYRLPKKVVDEEIQEIVDLGINIKVNTRVGKTADFNKVTKEYDACFIAAGAHRSMELGIPGEGTGGVISALDFLKKVTLGEKVSLGTKVVIIGGGNSAVDSARTAKRLGAKEVTIVYRRSAEEMPAYKEEVTSAEEEGIKILFLAMPVQIHSEGKKLSKLECVKAKLGKKDSDGRRTPEPIKDSNFMIEADTVIAALGESLELPFPDGTVKMSGPVIEVDELGRTSKDGIFAGGDAASLTRTVVEAIASGKRAALGIDLYLSRAAQGKAAPFRKGKGGAISMGRYLAGDTKSDPNVITPYEKLNLACFDKEPRTKIKELSAKTRTRDFSETKLGLSKEGAKTEAERCFHCGTCILCEVCYISCPDMAISLSEDGPSFSEESDVCKSCGICIYECPRNAISWEGVV